MVSSGATRSCSVCKTVLESGDEWIALDGGEIWCANCWRAHFMPPAERLSNAEARDTSGKGSGALPDGRLAQAAAEGLVPCQKCGHLCDPGAAKCPQCGGHPSADDLEAALEKMGLHRAGAQPAAPPRAPTADSPFAQPVSGAPFVSVGQGQPGTTTLASGSPIVHQINIGQPVGPAGSGVRTSGLAVASFVLGLAGIFCFGFLTGTLALIFGAVAMRSISKNPALKGYGLAVAGFIIGSLDVIGWAIWIAVMVEQYPNRLHF